MAGKRHHYIPQFLQRGFASHSCRDEFYTWVYRKNTLPFNANIANTGVEGHFYSQDGDCEAGDSITEAENAYSALVDALRGGSNDAINDSLSLSRLVTHLELRTRHFRQSFSNTASLARGELRLAERLKDCLEDNAWVWHNIRSGLSAGIWISWPCIHSKALWCWR